MNPGIMEAFPRFRYVNGGSKSLPSAKILELWAALQKDRNWDNLNRCRAFHAILLLRENYRLCHVSYHLAEVLKLMQSNMMELHKLVIFFELYHVKVCSCALLCELINNSCITSEIIA